MMNGSRIWVETNDFIRYFDGSVTPTGIGRVQAEIFRALLENHAERMAFLNIGRSADELQLVDPKSVFRAADGNRWLQRYGHSKTLLPAFKLLRFLKRRGVAVARRRMHAAADRQRFAETVRPGDILLNLGASWSEPNYGRTVRELKERHGLRFVLLVHDLLPVTHLHLVNRGWAPTFRAWLNDMALTWDVVLTPSRSTASNVRQFLDSRSLPLPPIHPIPFGAGFAGATPRAHEVPLERRKHVLFVSTIEVRKNHLLMFRIWERLIREYGRHSIPDLVFAGKYGWEIKELKTALRASRCLGGKIRIVNNLSDEELAGFYQDSLFTVFPSFAEGWGLPVAESFCFGRYCIASRASSIPEAGGAFADYHDPGDAGEAFRLIERAIFDREFLESREKLIRESYGPPSWRTTADKIIEIIDRDRHAIETNREVERFKFAAHPLST